MAMHTRKKRISNYLKEILEEQIGPNDIRTKNKAIAQELIKLALDEDTEPKLKLAAIEAIMDRIEGKAVAINLNADIVDNPFDGIDTAKLEALKKSLEELK